jgi:hypothetical protein
MRRDGRSSSAGFLRVLGRPLVTPTETNQSSAFNRRAGRRRGRPGEQSSSSTERGAVPILSRPAIQPRSELPPPARNGWGSSFVAGSVFDERRKALGFSVAVGSSADTVAFARSEGPGLVLLTVPFIGRERGENSGAVWRPHSGHKLKLKKTPPAPGLATAALPPRCREATGLGGEVKRAHPLPGPLPPAGEGITRACFNGKPPLIRPFGTPSPTDGRRKIHTHPLPTVPLAKGDSKGPCKTTWAGSPCYRVNRVGRM